MQAAPPHMAQVTRWPDIPSLTPAAASNALLSLIVSLLSILLLVELDSDLVMTSVIIIILNTRTATGYLCVAIFHSDIHEAGVPTLAAALTRLSLGFFSKRTSAGTLSAGKCLGCALFRL